MKGQAPSPLTCLQAPSTQAKLVLQCSNQTIMLTHDRSLSLALPYFKVDHM